MSRRFWILIIGLFFYAGNILASNDVSGLQWIRKEGDHIYITSKLDLETDIFYWFKKCMFNELFTFYRVAIAPNKQPLPISTQDSIPLTILNLTYSDNIGPFDISGAGFCGGNHSYNGGIKTAENVGYRLFIDGVELKQDTLALVNNIEIKVINNILNPTMVGKRDNASFSNYIWCIETVDYIIKKNNIQVSVKHEYQNNDPVMIKRYYGMQSMFENETEILTSNGQYYDWTPLSHVSRFIKKDYPHFNRFIERNSIGYQSSYLLKDGLGDHSEISDTDVSFIGNSSGKNYHKLIADKERKRGDYDSWKGVYTWFRKPIRDDKNVLCYEGIINGKEAIYIDCKTKCDLTITLPPNYKNRRFSLFEKISGIHVSSKIASSMIEVSSKNQGSCIIIFL